MNEREHHPSKSTVAQIGAAIEMLADDRGPMQLAARERLLRWGDVAVPQLREGAEAEHLRTRTRCRAVLRSIDLQQLVSRFARLRLERTGRASAPVLLEGAVLAAQMVRTFVPEPAQLAARLRRVASGLQRECEGRSLPTCARLLAERLHDQLGLRGGRPEQVDVEQVLVDRVMRCGLGSPVSLSLIYLLVARWAGLSAAGVALPNHFLVRLHGPRPVLLDPFHGGRTITKTDCARYLRSQGVERVQEHLRDLTDREVLIHYLRALRRSGARRSEDEGRASLDRALSLLELG
ncbi:MAG: transglutaminase family protein [Planctomycetota bacterium]